MPLHPVGCQPTALQIRPPMPRTYNFVQLSSSPCRLPTYSPTSSPTHASYLQVCPTMPTRPLGCQPTALQVRPPMPRTYNFVQLSPTSSSTHASYSQVCPTTPPHPVGCQPTALEVRPPMPRTYNIVELSPTSSSTHASYSQVCPTTPPHPVGCQPTALEVRPPMPRTYNFDQLSPTSSSTHASYLLLTSLSNYASSPCRLPTYSPTSSSTHASYLQLCPTKPYKFVHPCRPCFLTTCKFVQLCLLTLWFANIHNKQTLLFFHLVYLYILPPYMTSIESSLSTSVP